MALDKEIMPYDPAKAKKLLAEAKADGVPVDNEIVLLSYPPQFPNAAELMEAFYGMYKAVGLNVKIQTIEYGQYGSWNYKPLPEVRPATLMQASHDNSSGDPVFSIFYKYGCDSSNSTFCDPALDKEIARVTDLGGQERVDGWSALARKLYEEYAPVVFLYHMVGFVAVNPRIDFQPDLSSNGEIRVQEIHFK
jgi:peptide/nickel transport system substrate-binding protein